MKKIVILLVILLATPALAVLRVDINSGQIKPMKIAVPYFETNNKATKKVSEEMLQLITTNLRRSGMFAPVNKASFIDEKPKSTAIPKFADWKIVGSEAVVTGSIKEESGKYKISFRLWDVFTGKQLTGKEFSTTKTNWRRIGHIISDEIYARLTGEKRYFDTRIAYVAESVVRRRKIKRVAIMDQDGTNGKFISGNRSLVLTPRFSPDGKKVLYITYNRRKQPRVYIRDLVTGTEEVIGDFRGMSFAPAFAPDGQSLAMTIAKNGNSDIYKVSLKSKRMKRLTKGSAIETTPSFSPDGEKIVFESDRGGSQQLYMMDENGGGQKRISFGNGRYAAPAWSPLGNYIAFVKMKKGLFYIGVMRPDGTGERILSQGFLAESPAWAPNGRTIIFTKQETRNSPTRLHTVDITGNNEQVVRTKTEASDPSWSALLPL